MVITAKYTRMQQGQEVEIKKPHKRGLNTKIHLPWVRIVASQSHVLQAGTVADCTQTP
jgi:hypothetical protein